MLPGIFLSLDGADGAGKSTQGKLLADWLQSQGHTVTQCVDPGGTPLGGELRRILLHTTDPLDLRAEALLFMASRAQLVNQVIRPALEAGQIVLSDRYLLANVVYQGHAGGLDSADLWRIGEFATGNLLPDRVFVFDIPLELAQTRRNSSPDRMEQRPDEFHRRVRQGFLAEVARQPNRLILIDASRTVGEVQEQLRAETAKVLTEHRGKR